jgi:hypothetical protein
MSEPVTLGRRLDRLGRRIAARHGVTPRWSGPFGVLLQHLGGLPSAGGTRFTRREVPVRRPLVAVGRPLPADLTSRLRPLVGEGVEAVRVHDDEAADTRARAHRADAVTVGNDVYFRAGRLQPREPRGFALLVHEATHVVERMRPGASWRRATSGGSGEEERLALHREAYALGQPAGPTGPDSGPVPGPPVNLPVNLGAAAPAAVPAPASWSTPAARPMTAASDRVVGVPAPAAIDLEALRAGLVRDLIGQLRDEFERGG